ncbi:MAG: patatin family protein [Oscillospiraceae bacterium]|jgi:predicted patatin/cPLA2 family phospholipase|nr:patatin family protein [Oscillospiraceae bacterium]
MSIGLVLEGGGMRGWYTAGVLTALTENGIDVPCVYGISAGASNALTYISKQITRDFVRTMIQYSADERYISVNNLQKTGSLFGFDFIFGELFHSLLPFDYETFFNSPVQLKVGATDLATGQAVFFDKSQLDEDMTAVRASCSLPFLSNVVSYRGHELLDGGCSMPIPIERSIFDGNERNVVVLTRDISYRKGPQPEFPRSVLRVKYEDYPLFVDTMMNRPETYNNELDVCRRQENAGKAFVIRPSSPIVISRYEKNLKKLNQLYEMGIRDCEAALEHLHQFLDQ